MRDAGERKKDSASRKTRVVFITENLDVRIVARPPSPFHLQHINGLDFDDVTFREWLMQHVSRI